MEQYLFDKTKSHLYHKKMDFNELLAIMAALRSERGCPWDKEQTADSLKPFILEETYEVLEAIDEAQPDALKEELGDLLFQVIFQAQLAQERNDFDMSDVIDVIARKMVARHPHVFGNADCKTSGDVLVQWESQKKAEGKQKQSVTDGIPRTLPALLRAHRIQDRVSRVGFDWKTLDDVMVKLDEELGEFRNAMKHNLKNEIQNELGDILFVLVNVSRFIGVNPEEALGKTIAKFLGRFRYMEMAAAHKGKHLSDMTLSEMDELWNEAKKEK